jgi:acyl carrier protein
MKTDDFINLLCEALGRKPGTLSMKDTKLTIDEWDSLGHLEIISTVADNLNVPVDNEEMRNFTSIQELFDRLLAMKALAIKAATHNKGPAPQRRIRPAAVMAPIK